ALFARREMPRLAISGHPNLTGGVMAVDDDLGVVGQCERQHALRQLDLHVVGIELAERVLEVTQLGVGDDVEVVLHAHGRDRSPSRTAHKGQDFAASERRPSRRPASDALALTAAVRRLLSSIFLGLAAVTVAVCAYASKPRLRLERIDTSDFPRDGTVR